MAIKKSVLLGVLAVLVLGTGFGGHSAQAEEWRGGHRGEVRRGGEGRWGEGRWVHDRHTGRLGWWWVVGSAWHFYARPYHPQTVIIEQQPQPPQVTVIQAPPAPPVLYYCKATGTYYPEIMTCPGGWTTHQAGTPPSS